MAVCQLCGDIAERGEDWCHSCALDVETELDELCDGQQPGVD